MGPCRPTCRPLASEYREVISRYLPKSPNDVVVVTGDFPVVCHGLWPVRRSLTRPLVSRGAKRMNDTNGVFGLSGRVPYPEGTEMTPIELVESDDDDPKERRERERARVSTCVGAIEELYGQPQHEVGCQPAEQKEAFYGEPQHEQLEECRWGEPFPWLLENDEEERRESTRSTTELQLRRLDRE